MNIFWISHWLFRKLILNEICFCQVYELTAELEKMNSIQSDHIAKVGTLTRQLEEKDSKLRRLQSERHRQLEEVYEMK